MSGRAAELAIAIAEKGAADTAAALDRVGSSASSMGDKVEAAGRSAEKGASGLDTAAGGADELASKGSQAAGAMGGLGDLIGGQFGAAMQTGGIALQAAADSGDLLNAALENSVVAGIRSKAATVANTVATKAQTVATRAMTIGQKALNLAQRASPIGLIVTGVLLLVGALVLAYKHSARFRAIVDKAMSVAKAGVSTVVKAFVALGPIVGKVASFIGKVVTTYVGVYVKAFKLSVAVVKAVWGAIRDAVGNAVSAITGKANDVRDKLTGVGRTIRDVGVKAFHALTAPIQVIVDLVQSLLDKISKIHLPSVGGLASKLNPFDNGGSDLTSSSTFTGAAPTQVVSIPVSITGGATTAQAAQFMQAVDDRLRSLGKRPVFS
jgi:hypothetical protein